MRKTKQILKYGTVALFSLLTLFVVFAPVFAAVSNEGWNPDGLTATNLPDRSVADILLTFIDWALVIIGLLGVIVFIYGGFIYLTAQGDPQNTERAKRIIIYAIVGIVVSVLGYVAVSTVDKIMKGDIETGGGGAAPTTGTPGPSGAPSQGGETKAPTGTPPPGPGGNLPISPGMMR